MSQQSQPYGPTDTEVYTTYTYDALGRTVNVLLADGASHTTYADQGNFTTITDPAGNWKQYASDAFGNLVTVLEPDPTANPIPVAPTPSAYPVTAAPTGMLLTTYTYDPLNHLTQAAMYSGSRLPNCPGRRLAGGILQTLDRACKVRIRAFSEWPVYLANPRARAALTHFECGACTDWTR